MESNRDQRAVLVNLASTADEMIYLDNHATTRCDPRVVEAMLPWLAEHFGNPHSSHDAGKRAASAIHDAIQSGTAIAK